MGPVSQDVAGRVTGDTGCPDLRQQVFPADVVGISQVSHRSCWKRPCRVDIVLPGCHVAVVVIGVCRDDVRCLVIYPREADVGVICEAVVCLVIITMAEIRQTIIPIAAGCGYTALLHHYQMMNYYP